MRAIMLVSNGSSAASVSTSCMSRNNEADCLPAHFLAQSGRQ
jgi:hypothetical protein